jgi:hypothetical protein
MRTVHFGGRLFEALASLRLAVTVMVTLGVVCAAGTFYETSHGMPAAQRDIYRTWWFGLLLGFLGANVFCAMVRRYPWRSHHVGFVTAHVGILIVLAGSLISLHWGLDANLPLLEGETSDRVSLLDRVLYVALPGRGADDPFPVDFEKRPPRPGREQRFPVPGSDVALVAEDFLHHVGPAPPPPPEKAEKRIPAVKVRLEWPGGRSASEWVPWTEARSFACRGSHAVVAYRPPQATLPFRVTLLDFSSRHYPGSDLAATYESLVRIDDPGRGVSEHLISMNHPLHYRGHVFFQASFVEGEPTTSVFSVARAPGLPLVYLGVVLISLGVVWMFYVKPWLARRQARTVEAGLQRVDVHEDAAPSTAPAPSARPAEPAPSGV